MQYKKDTSLEKNNCIGTQYARLNKSKQFKTGKKKCLSRPKISLQVIDIVLS
jgi:hypothetical protein